MRRHGWFALAVPFACGCTAQADLGGGTSAATPVVLALPLEVLGSGAPDEPVIASAQLAVASADLANVQTLYVVCHRCGFYGPPEFEALSKPLTRVKASLRIAGGASDAGDAGEAGAANDAGGSPWIDITDGNVSVDSVAAAHGGINGGLVTLGFHVSLDEATRARLVGAPATNQIEFRFNGTDGISNGFRILDLQFQDRNSKTLSPVAKSWADISLEKSAGASASSASMRGAMWWTARNSLQKSTIVARTLRAACSDCHAADGRDLQYFNYSNNAIVQRSRFYGLTTEQGQDIAAYLRASLAQVPHVAAAAPWNPPYQPGPGLDSKPAVEWAAGAGLAAVLPDGAAFVKAFVGQPVDDTPLVVTQAQITAALDPTQQLNTREMPIALQLPDWNSWLPSAHPLDIWTPDAGATSGLFEAGYQGKTPLAAYAALSTFLSANENPNGNYGDWSNLTANQRKQLQALLQDLGGQTLGFGGGGQGSRISPDAKNPYGIQLGGQGMQALLASATAALADLSTCGPVGPCTPFSSESFIERANLGLYQWLAVKQWEGVENYGLQAQPEFHGSVDASGNWVGQGEVRGWPYDWPSVFYLAPRTIFVPQTVAQGTRESYFSWENRLTSWYRSNQWEELQVSVNPGWAGASNGALDWPTALGDIESLADDLSSANAPGGISAAHLARFFLNTTKLSQLANTDIPFDSPSATDPTNLLADLGGQSKADLLFKLSPAVVLDSGASQPTRFRGLEEIAPGLYLSFVNGMLSSYDALFTSTMRSEYRICDPTNMQLGDSELYAGQRFCIDAARTPLPLDAQSLPYCPYPADSGYTTEQFSVWGVMAATQLGADPSLVQRWSDWNDRMWPN